MRQYSKSFFGFLATLVLSGIAASAQADISDPQKVLSSKSATVLSSVELVRLNDLKVLFEYQADKLLTPASVTKLVTASALLDTFTPSKVFETKFYYTGSKKRGVITGDLVVVGDGDPFFVSERLWQLAADFRQMGITQVRGGIIVDNSLFDSQSFDPSRVQAIQRSQNAYDAPITAFGVNFNTVAVSIFPSEVRGAAPLVTLDPYPLDAVTVQNLAKTTTGKSTASLNIERLSANNGAMKVAIKGQIGSNADLSKFYRSVSDPVAVSGDFIKTFLRKEGIGILGPVKSGVLPPNAEFLYKVNSYPMQRLIDGLNKFSSNFIADVLTKRLGAEMAGLKIGSGSYDNGLKQMTNFMRDTVGIKSEFVIRNGSGLDTQNLLSSRQLTKLLVHVKNRLDIFPEFLSSLPAAGWDGTLKKRMRGHQEMSGLIRAKTGTLSEPVSVVSLSGYLQHPTHGLCAFSIIQNGVARAAQPGIEDLRNMQDDLLAYFMTKL